MAILTWDSVGTKIYETGIDRGVLYLPTGYGVPWNGLASVTEKFDISSNPIYFDGMKIQDVLTLGDFSATLKAITYPDEFLPFDGLGSYVNGMYLDNQTSDLFGFSYRTKVGSDQNDDAGYKIHVVYNASATPSDKTFETISDSLAPMEFEWNITTIPEEIPGYRPTAHFIFDSRKFDAALLVDLEAMLYGSDGSHSFLPPASVLVDVIDRGYLIMIVDNGDGTWTAIASNDDITFTDSGHTSFQITEANVIWTDSVTYILSDTFTPSDST